MSETTSDKNLRTQKEINEDYTKCAVQYGDLCFKMMLMNEQLKVLSQKMSELNQEKPLPQATV